MSEKIVGIIGGMGPAASASLYWNIVRLTPVNKDQGHFRVVMDSNPGIPDRTAAIEGRGVSPVQYIIQTGKNLELLGATVGAMPCITAHYYYEEIHRALSYQLLNALEELKKYIMLKYPGTMKIGILATTGTVNSRLFDRYLPQQLLYPGPHLQEKYVMEAVYGINGIKRGNTGEHPRRLLQWAGEELIQKGAQILVAGCTEIPLALSAKNIATPLLDVIEILARALIEFPEPSRPQPRHNGDCGDFSI